MRTARDSRPLGRWVLLTLIFCAGTPLIVALASDAGEDQTSNAPALTIYNQRFAVVRQKLPLDLRSDVNHVQVTDITAHLEPDSVILRSLDSGRRLQILEQNYRNDPVSQALLLSRLVKILVPVTALGNNSSVSACR